MQLSLLLTLPNKLLTETMTIIHHLMTSGLSRAFLWATLVLNQTNATLQAHNVAHTTTTNSSTNVASFHIEITKAIKRTVNSKPQITNVSEKGKI